MTPERWQQVESILQAVLDISSSAERASFVSDACAGDEELRATVERLVSADEEAESFIESPAWAGSGMLDSIAGRSFKNSLGKGLSAGDENLPNDADDLSAEKLMFLN